MRKGAETRERILDIAETSVLAKGFGATSIEEVIAEAGITKSGFFYHFKDKNELARAMILRYIETNDRLFDDLFGRSRELSDDPLQAFLIGLKLFAEVIRDLPNGHPGCLVASVCYQERLFDREVREPVDMAIVADMLSCVVDGGIIMSKVLDDPLRLEAQVLAFRSFVKMLFTPAAQAAVPRSAAIAAE
jgi:AcrR family transcriptional regulator